MTPRIINISMLKRPSYDTSREYTGVQILKTYPAQIDCNVNSKYFDLYVCKQRTNLDTIYIFNECAQVSDFALDTTINIEVVFYRNDTLKSHPDKVTVFVPKTLQISKNAKYAFVKLKGIVL
ncbi:hypothetical protein Mucpa_4109 [Mucilaginibacter paludis DSM 18603]|uniref:Uncharacterized protein n=2 Tax=Mucilaginibacter TaxID=423349 RepID=H1Y0F1_9SPHI|nr:hypothetical protein Mucpa_4109 [Mucilaginibacter paludis DSM 18603]